METLSDGTQVTVDDNYIRESILVPGAKIVKGYQPIMPSFQGSLKDRHIEGLIEFIKAQK
jgi:cytochrome c oxidase subunit 2